MQSLINDRIYSEDFLSKAKINFQQNPPYPHIIIDDFLSSEIADALFEHFPTSQ